MAHFTAIHDIPTIAAPGETFSMDDENAAARLIGMNAIRVAAEDEVKMFEAVNAKSSAKKSPAKKETEPKGAAPKGDAKKATGEGKAKEDEGADNSPLTDI